jgi:eukaryotic-like serine/threonine-protein kinase
VANEGNPDKDELLSLAASVADGDAVDWNAAESSAQESDTEGAVRQLRLLNAVGTIHRRVASVVQREVLAERSDHEFVGPPAADVLEGAQMDTDRAETRTWNRLEILELVGEGSYGEVFRAWDPRLSRQVALKLLRKEPSAAPQGSAVIREASMMARVNHPNVVTIYGADKSDGHVGIWMEFIRGRTLEQILATSGPFSPRETALIGLELCRAVGAVHRAGLVHRDLKAHNVMRERGGRLVLMDFGTGHELSDERAVQDLVGTPLYAAPEVIDGQDATCSSDMYSLGVLLFHLLTGLYPITGRTLEEVRRAHWEKRGKLLRDVLPDLPADLIQAIDRALHPVPAERPSSVGELENQLLSVLAGHHAGEPERVLRSAPSKSTWWLVSAAATVTLCAATAAAVLWTRPSQTRMATKLVMPLSPADFLKEDPAFDRPLSTAITVSPNGNRLAFVGQIGKTRQIYVRHLTESTAELLDETDGASSPEFSPDGAWLAFVTGNLIRKVPSTGGEATTVAEVVRRVRPPGTSSVLPSAAESDVYGLTWRGTSEMVFGRFAGGLWRVSAAGGTPVQLTSLDESAAEFAHRLPHFLPGGDTVLFTAVSGVAAASTKLVAFSLSTGQRHVVLEDAADGRYVSTGHLVFMRQGQLMGVPFNPTTARPVAPPAKLLDGVMQSLFSYRNQLNVGAAQYAFSDDGQTFVYVPGSVFPDESRSLVWVDASGKSVPTAVPKGAYMRPDVSPNGQSALFTCWSGGRPYVCAFDFDRQVSRRITEGLWPLWSPDGMRIAFGRLSSSGVYNLFGMTLDGSSEAELLLQSTRDQWAGSWSPDGSELAYVETSPATDNDIWILSLKDRKVRAFLRTPAREDHPEFSPGGRWMAFTSNESGRDEVYITESPTPKTQIQVSTDGGSGPVWSRDGSQLFYATSDEPDGLTVMAVTISYEPRLVLSIPRKVVSGDYLALASVRSYDISADGQRFLLVHDPPDTHVTHVNVVLNWDLELRGIGRK